MNAKSTMPAARETDHERDDAPRLTREIAGRAQLAIGDHIIREGRPRGRPPKAPGERKEAVSLRLSPSVVAHFRATGEGWQTRIDEALQAVVRGKAPSGRSADRGRPAETVHEDRAAVEPRENPSAGRKRSS
jgi:uncharacterized protein (DUF4415 family)